VVALDPGEAIRAAPSQVVGLRIRVLGRFEAERDGDPLHGKPRSPRKPLELLQVLISHGGRDVPEMLIAEALWPDAEGDAAHHALETALYRLRLMVGKEAVVLRDRRLSLAMERCWVDALELEARLGAALQALEKGHGAADRAPLAADAARIAALYRGPLLMDEAEAPWAARARERLRVKLARWLGAIAALSGDPASAAAVRARIREADPEIRLPALLHVA